MEQSQTSRVHRSGPPPLALVFLFLGVLWLAQDYVVYPRLIGHGVRLHPLAVILAILCGAELGGVAGIFLAIPAVAVLSVAYQHWLAHRAASVPDIVTSAAPSRGTSVLSSDEAEALTGRGLSSPLSLHGEGRPLAHRCARASSSVPITNAEDPRYISAPGHPPRTDPGPAVTMGSFSMTKDRFPPGDFARTLLSC